MSTNDIDSTYIFGFYEMDNKDTKSFKGYDLFPENIRNFTAIRSIKIWFGNPPEEKEIKALLGIQIMYLNYFTGERKLTDYQGTTLLGDNVETKELNIKDDDYLSKFYIGFNQFITHIKFETKKGDFIELGTYDEIYEKNSVNEVNEKVIRTTLEEAVEALTERGYNPINQLVGYIISGDLGYISSYKETRNRLSKIDRSTLVEVILKEYLK